VSIPCFVSVLLSNMPCFTFMHGNTTAVGMDFRHVHLVRLHSFQALPCISAATRHTCRVMCSVWRRVFLVAHDMESACTHRVKWGKEEHCNQASQGTPGWHTPLLHDVSHLVSEAAFCTTWHSAIKVLHSP
jgi:hypothetical protein